MNNRLLLSFLMLFSFSIFSSVSEQDLLDEVTQEIKQKYQAHEADPLLQKITQEILQKAGIARPIIVLQNNEIEISSVVCLPWKHSQEFVIIGTKGNSLKAIIASLYHETGHLAHKDVSYNKYLFKKGYSYAAGGGTVAAGFVAWNRVLKFAPKRSILALIGGGFTAVTTFIAAVFFDRYLHYKMEKNADIFAYKQMFKDKELTALIGQISDYLYCVQYGLSSLPPFISGYPTNFQRAACGIKILQEEGVVIKELVNNLPEDLDSGIKGHFPDQMERYFPKLME